MSRAPRPIPVDDDDGDGWKHDDQAERSPRERRAAEQRAFDANQLWIYRTMRKLYDVIEADWRASRR